MRRPLPEPRVATRRRRVRALALLPLAVLLPTTSGASGAVSRPIDCAVAPASNASDALATHACVDVCGTTNATYSLCVYRLRAPSTCAVDCVPTVAAATTWTVVWVDSQPNTSSALVVTSNDVALNATVIHTPVERIDQGLSLPPSIVHFSVAGPRTTTLMPFELSDATRSSFSRLRYLDLTRVDMSDWKTLPSMPSLRNLSLNDVDLNWWPLTQSHNDLEELSLDHNRLADFAANLEMLPISLRSLSLRSTGLTTLPPSLSSLESLHELLLDGNKIPVNDTAYFPHSLQTLSLRDCALPLVPDRVASLLALDALDLSLNPELKLPTNASFLPSTVTTLRLAGCGLKSFPVVAAATHRQLRILDLSSNALQDTDAALSGNLSMFANLSTLDLSNTKRPRVPDAIANMDKLTSLSLASNKIVAVDAAALPPSLEHLNIAHNAQPLSLSLPPALASSLLSLNISYSGLSSLALVQPLAKLQTLDASGNALVSTAFPSALPGSLRFLNLSNNRLTTVLDALFQLTALEELDLRGNPIPAGAVTALSSSQVAFLDGLRSFFVDPAVFKSSDCGPSASPVTFSFGYTVCASASRHERNVSDPAAAAAARARVNRNLYIIAGTIGTALLLVTLASFAMRRSGRDTRKRGLMDADGAWPTELASDREMTDAEWRALQMWSFWDDEDVLRLRIPWDLVRDRQVIGSGQYSVLWLARVASQPVFLKALQPTAHRNRHGDGDGSVAAVASLIREIQLLRCLRHAHIVRLVGVTWMNAPTDVQVAIEDMANGDLRGYLELTQPPAPPSRWRNTGLGDGFSLRVALQIAEALVFLHRCGVAHNDLRSRNVVLDDNCCAKLTGFGRHVFVEPVAQGEDDEKDHLAEAVARAVAASAVRDKELPPPSVDNAFLLDSGRWMAPEVLRRHLRSRRRSRTGSSTARTLSRSHVSASTTATSAASTAADVYAFGVLLLELDSFELPFARVETDDDMLDDSSEDDDVHYGRAPNAPPAVAPGPHDPNDLRFSSMPSNHNSLLGGPAAPITFGSAVPKHEHLEDADESDVGLPQPPRTGGTMSVSEEKAELALLRKLADGAVHVDLSTSCPAFIRDVILQCLEVRPERRPSMRAVRDALQAFVARAPSQRHRSSTGSSGTAPNSTTTRSMDSSQRSLVVHTLSGGRSGCATVAVAATQTLEEDHALVDGSSSADSDATTAFFVMQQSPARRSATPNSS